jgi:hypothetical protein
VDEPAFQAVTNRIETVTTRQQHYLVILLSIMHFDIYAVTTRMVAAVRVVFARLIRVTRTPTTGC